MPCPRCRSALLTLETCGFCGEPIAYSRRSPTPAEIAVGNFPLSYIREIPQSSLLLSQIAACCRKHNLSKTKFGRLFCNDPQFITDLSNGRVLKSLTKARLYAFMKNPTAQKETSSCP